MFKNNNNAAAQGYELRVTKDFSAWQKDSPVMVESVAVLAQGEDMFARCAFRSMTDRPAKSLTADIILKDEAGNVTETIEGIEYKDFYTVRDSLFGMKEGVKLSASKAFAEAEVQIKKVLFVDGEEYIYDGQWINIPQQQTLASHFEDDEILEEYLRETGVQGAYVAEKHDGFWQCACEAVNDEHETECFRCGDKIDTLLEKMDEEALAANLAAYKAELARIEEENRLIAEEKARKAAKTRKTIIIAVIVVVVLAAAFVVYNSFLKDKLGYNSALKAMEAGEYQTAMTKFEKLGDYEDSAQLAEECTYLHAVKLTDERAYAEAIDLFDELDGYKESSEYRKEAMYGYVKANLDRTNEDTYDYLKELKKAEYEDAADIYKELYKWKAELNINNSETDLTTNMPELSKQDKVFCHVKLNGGTPGQTTELKYKAVYPNGSVAQGAWSKSWTDGDTGQCSFWYDIPEYGAKGDFKVYVYDKETGKLLVESSVKLTD